MGAVRHSQRTRMRVLEHFAETGRIDIACQDVGVARDCHYDWLKKVPGYREAFEEAREKAADLLESEAWRRAHTGVKKPVFSHGKRAADFVIGSDGQPVKDPETGKLLSQPAFVQEYSDNVLMFLLKGRRREVYGDKAEFTGKDGTALFGIDAMRAYMATVPDDEE